MSQGREQDFSPNPFENNRSVRNLNGPPILDPIPDDRRSVDLTRNQADELGKKFNDSFVTEKRGERNLLPAALRDDRLEKFS